MEAYSENGVIVSILLFISYIVTDSFGIYSLVIIFSGIAVIEAIALAMYGFGVLIEKISSIDNTLKAISKFMKSEEIEDKQTPASVVSAIIEQKQTIHSSDPQTTNVIRDTNDEKSQQPENTTENKSNEKPEVDDFIQRLSYALKYATEDGIRSYLQFIADERVEQIRQAPQGSIRVVIEEYIKTNSQK